MEEVQEYPQMSFFIPLCFVCGLLLVMAVTIVSDLLAMLVVRPWKAIDH